MAITDYQSTYLARKLTLRRAGASIEKFATTLTDAQVELNPHQIDAALFAFQSPLSKGVLLADEVGLGKTIEAGLVVAQYWAERKRHILIITPASLTKQWAAELSEKFFLPMRILERQAYTRDQAAGYANPFRQQSHVFLVSYDFASRCADDIAGVPWDLVVMDEAHYLRNVYRPGSKRAKTIRDAVEGRRKLLLSATPLQNSLNELFGLVSVIDPMVFGDLASFRSQYANPANPEYERLKQRIKPLAKRTLREDVAAYIPYTKRIPLVQEFLPSKEEIDLYDQVNDYLNEDRLYGLPSGQRHLMTLILQKLQASSTLALAPSLAAITRRLRARIELNAPLDGDINQYLEDGYEGLEDVEEAFDLSEDDEEPVTTPSTSAPRSINDPTQWTKEQRQEALGELGRLSDLATRAQALRSNEKGRALLTGLRMAFEKASDIGSPRKVIIFTEFKRTQEYILEVLTSDPEFRDGGIVLFNGSNTHLGARETYDRWLAKHRGTDRVTGARALDTRQALVDEFRDNAQIMIATEAAAQGLNLQFCALIINYDLPWNPQRIEQRIGRCHRYGQKHDVVVVNFLDKHNAADRRVHELLNEKYHLFQGVFGASDEVLGDIRKGVELERRLATIYRTARTPAQIGAAFDALQDEFRPQIDADLLRTRTQLFAHFDEDVTERLQTRKDTSERMLSRVEQDLMRFTEHELAGAAEFVNAQTFRLHSTPPALPSAPLGTYALPRGEAAEHVYRLGGPLAEALLERAKARDLPIAHLTFDYEQYGRKVSVVEQLRGQAGVLECTAVTMEGQTESEDALVLTAFTNDGVALAPEVSERLLAMPVRINGERRSDVDGLRETETGTLTYHRNNHVQRVVAETTDRQTSYLDAEADKLDRWAEDLVASLRLELRDLEKWIKELKRLVRLAGNMVEKTRFRRDLTKLESTYAAKQYEQYQKSMEIQAEKERVLDEIEAQLKQTKTEQPVFTIRWSVV